MLPVAPILIDSQQTLITISTLIDEFAQTNQNTKGKRGRRVKGLVHRTTLEVTNLWRLMETANHVGSNNLKMIQNLRRTRYRLIASAESGCFTTFSTKFHN